MIAFTPKAIAAIAIAAALVAGGLYVRHLHKQAARVPDLEQAINDLHTQIGNERAQIGKALEKENALQKELAAARNTSSALADRLRRAYATELPKAPADSAVADGAPGTGSGPGELDAAVARVIGACKADSLRLGEWQRYFEEVPAELK